MNNEGTSIQKVSTKEEVSKFISTEYSATLNLNNLTLEEGTLKITGPLLSTDDWNKIKKNGNKEIPYRITVLMTDKNNKVAKIAIYQDGKAIIE